MKPTIKWRHQYDRETDELIGNACATVNNEPTLTQQHFADNADINILVKRLGLEDAPLPVEAFDPRYYGDFSNVPDLRTALDLVRDAENRFMELPARLRSKFDNSSAKLWSWIQDPDNGPEAVRLGLLQEPKKEPETAPKTDTSTETT